MRRLHIAAAGDDVEAAAAPFVPDGGKQHGAVAPIRGQDSQQAELHQISEIVHGEAPAHASRLTNGGPLAHPGPGPKVNRVGDPVKSLESRANTHSGRRLKTLLDAGSTMSKP